MFSSCCFFLCFVLLLLFPDPVRAGAAEGLTLWYTSVVPILFPFLILTNGMLASNSMSLILRPVFHCFHRIFPLFNPWIIYPLFLGLFCGFPMGAKITADLVHEGKLTIKEGNLLLPAVNQASPMFISGYVGTYILNRQMPLYLLFLCIYVPPMVYLILSSLLDRQKSSPYLSSDLKQNNSFLSSSYKEKDSMSHPSEHAIWNSFAVIVTIGVYMMLFAAGAKLCLYILSEQPGGLLLTCLLEFSTGLYRLSQIPFLSDTNRLCLIVGLTSFGGLCTAAQTCTIIRGTKLSIHRYMLWKCLLAAGACLCCYVYYSSSS